MQRELILSIVTIKINGKDYQVACGDGEEERLHMLANEVDERLQSIVFPMKNKPNEAMSLLLTNLLMADELSEKQKEIEEIQQESKKAIARASVKRDSGEADARIAEMENAMAATMNEIAARLEKITDEIEA
ncbi:MAG: cell division protein ZapA [Rickettsiales bacterium]